jgi:hypothetical protein
MKVMVTSFSSVAVAFRASSGLTLGEAVLLGPVNLKVDMVTWRIWKVKTGMGLFGIEKEQKIGLDVAAK